MATSDVACIYCSTLFDPTKGEGDHIIPALLGEFRNDVRFRRICPACNNKIGQSEQQLVQSGPEGFFRQIVKPNSKRFRRRSRSSMKGAMGAPAPEFASNMGEGMGLVEPSKDDPSDVIPVDCLTIVDGDGNEVMIRLYSGMRPDQLRKKLKESGISEIKNAYFNIGSANYDEFASLVRAVSPKAQFENGKPMPPGTYQSEGSCKFTVNSHYYRAYAKIAFHYYLAHSKRGYRGDEPFFSGIREFIMNGGDIDQLFRKSKNTFKMPFGAAPAGGVATPSQWGHILAAEETDREAVAYAQLFVGPGHIPTPHYVVLGELPSRLVLPSYKWAHVYRYDEEQGKGRYAGEVIKASLSKIRPL